MSGPAVEIDLPAGWRHRTDAAPLALAARPGEWRPGFAPNITVAVTPAVAGESPEAYLARQLDGAAATLTDPLLVDATVDRAARSVTFLLAHATTGLDLTVVQHHHLGLDGWVLAAAGTAADDDWPTVAVDLLAAVRSVRPTR